MRLTGALPSTVPRASVSGTVMSPSMTATNIICSHQPSRHNGRIGSGKRQWEPYSILHERAVVAPRIDGGGKGRVTEGASRGVRSSSPSFSSGTLKTRMHARNATRRNATHSAHLRFRRGSALLNS